MPESGYNTTNREVWPIAYLSVNVEIKYGLWSEFCLSNKMCLNSKNILQRNSVKHHHWLIILLHRNFTFKRSSIK